MAAVGIFMHSFIVVPAKAGTQGYSLVSLLDSRLRGNDEEK
jgi:hypothetical protein